MSLGNEAADRDRMNNIDWHFGSLVPALLMIVLTGVVGGIAVVGLVVEIGRVLRGVVNSYGLLWAK